MARKAHVLVIPLAAQGHVAPLMKLSLQIAAHGMRVTVVNSESVHEKIMASVSANGEEQSLISLVSTPDTLESGGDQRNAALEVAEEMGIGGIAVQLAGPAVLALSLHIPQLTDAEILDNNGTLEKGESILLSKEIPAWSRSAIPWNSSDLKMQKAIFQLSCTISKMLRYTKLILSNTFYELEASALKLIPNILPIGPFHVRNDMGTFAGNFWAEDSICLSWLDKQTAGSVIYVAFGSTGKFSQQEVDELALGLEALNSLAIHFYG
ncbi:hypothetical protein REPUB_Repub07fG0049400 [Reevesia pubescens]